MANHPEEPAVPVRSRPRPSRAERGAPVAKASSLGDARGVRTRIASERERELGGAAPIEPEDEQD